MWVQFLPGAQIIQSTQSMDGRKQEAVLTSRKLVADGAYEVSFELSESIQFAPGQYAWVILPELAHPDRRGNRRSFSIISTPSDAKNIRFLFRVHSPNSGYKKTLLELPLGSRAQIDAPFGLHTLPNATTIIMVAGGVGISSFLSIIRDMEERGAWRQLTLIFGNSSQKSAPFLDELRMYAKNRPIFELREVEGSISKEHLPVGTTPKDTRWLLAGPKEMTNKVAAVLTAADIDPGRVLCEEFPPPALDKGLPVIDEQTMSDSNFYKLAVENASNHVIFTDIEGTIVYCNKAAEHITGYTFEEMRGSTPRLWGGLMDKNFYEHLWRIIKRERKPYSGKIKNRRKNGEVYTVIARISPVLGRDGDLIGFLGTEEDITDLEKIDQAKTEFVSLASHQLRSPLSVINWYTEMLLGEGVGGLNEKQKRYLSEVKNGSRRMTELVKDLLNVSRLELGTLVIEPRPVSLPALIAEAVQEQAPDLHKKNIKLNESYAPQVSTFPADPKFLKIIVQNLLSNAVKYTQDGGEVSVRTELADGKMVLSVSDTGYGIPEDQQRKIFTKLFRARNVVKKDTEGSGIGLYLVKSIVERSGGSIWFTSKEGAGTTFFVAFPAEGMRAQRDDIM